MPLHCYEARLSQNVQMPAGGGLCDRKRFGNQCHTHAELRRISRPLVAEVFLGVCQKLKDSQPLLAGHCFDLG